jgi:hypothetical protein
LEPALRTNPATRNVDPFCNAMLKVTSFNDREAIGLMNALHQNPHVGKRDADSIVLAVAKCCFRHGIFNSNLPLRDAMRPMVDQALARSFAAVRKGGISPEEFRSTRDDLVGMVLDAADWAQVAASGASLRSVGPALHRLAGSCALGDSMFRVAAEAADVGCFSDDVDKALDPLRSAKTFSEASLGRAQAELRALVARAGEVGHLAAGKRTIEVRYMNTQVALVVSSASAECDLKLAGLCRWHALRYASVHYPRLRWEELLTSRTDAAFKESEEIPAFLQEQIKEFQPARTLCAQLLSKSEPSAHEWRKRLLSQEDELQRLSWTVKIELAFVDCQLAPLLVEEAISHILRCFPTKECKISLQDCICDLAGLGESDLFKAAGGAATGPCAAALEVVRGLAKGIAPQAPPSCDAWFAEVLDRTQWFVRIEPGSLSKDLPQELMLGADAVRFLLDQYTLRYAEDAQSVGLADLDRLIPYKHTLAPLDAERCASLATKCLAALGGGAASSSKAKTSVAGRATSSHPSPSLPRRRGAATSSSAPASSPQPLWRRA